MLDSASRSIVLAALGRTKISLRLRNHFWQLPSRWIFGILIRQVSTDMVRFKNRHLLVEFLNLSTCSPTVSGTVSALPISPTAGFTDPDDEDDELSPIPPLPFLVPGHDPTSARLKLGDEGGGHIFRVIRSVIQEVFGDEGWARVASSFKSVY